MFDIGFFELVLLLVVSLLVLGPKRLPVVARQIGIWRKKAQTYWQNMSEEFSRQGDLVAIQEQLKAIQNQTNGEFTHISKALTTDADIQEATQLLATQHLQDPTELSDEKLTTEHLLESSVPSPHRRMLHKKIIYMQTRSQFRSPHKHWRTKVQKQPNSIFPSS